MVWKKKNAVSGLDEATWQGMHRKENKSDAFTPSLLLPNNCHQFMTLRFLSFQLFVVICSVSVHSKAYLTRALMRVGLHHLFK